jgi:heptosyltransferase-2
MRARLPTPPTKIFVRGPNWVGDLVMATASFERIRAAYPHAEIALGVRRYLKPLLHGSKAFDRILDAPRGGLGALMAQTRELRDGAFDLAIVLPNSLAAALPSFLARIPWRLGYRQGRPLLMNLGLRAERGRPWYRRHGPRRVPKPMPHYYQDLLDVLDLPPGGIRPSLVVTPEESASVDRWMAERQIGRNERLVLLNAGASYGGSKFWVAERFAAVARHFAGRGYRPLFLAGPAEVEMVEAIAKAADAIAVTRPVLPLDGLKALVARSALMITTDTGPRHVAVAFDRPTVCLIGPTDRRYTDYCLDKTELIQKDLPCVPCQRKVCPLGHHDCMRKIEVDEVVAAAERLLAKFGDGS